MSKVPLRYQQPRVSIVRRPPVLLVQPLPPEQPSVVGGAADSRDWLFVDGVRVSALKIRAAVVRALQVSETDFVSERRFRRLVLARQVFYWLCRKLTNLSLAGIAIFAGGKDHSTILHGIQMVDLKPAKFSDAISAALALLDDEKNVVKLATGRPCADNHAMVAA